MFRRLTRLAAVVALSFLAAEVSAAPSGTPVTVKGPHYTVTSWAGADSAQDTLNLMEALLVRYNGLFLFDLKKVTTPWVVTVYATKADFVEALTGQVAAEPRDYVYLHYADPAKSVLATWAPAEGEATTRVRSLAFQGFFQFLWTFIPRPPAWLETGLASVFWNSRWDGKSLQADADLPFLETLQARWKDAGPDLASLLTAQEGSLDPGSGRDLEAWGLAAFLMENPDPTWARLFGSTLANLAPAATEEANREAAYQRFRTAKDLTTASAEVRSWWLAKTGFAGLVDRGAAAWKAKDYPAAATAFQAALALRPTDSTALYYAGLTAYETKDYAGAETKLAAVKAEALPAGLLAYARGLTAFALKKNPEAKTYLEQAKAEDEKAWGSLVAPVLDLIR